MPHCFSPTTMLKCTVPTYRFLQAANACRYWPSGRGIFHNKQKTFLVWVGD